MHIGPWYDPIERRWQKPKPPSTPEIVKVDENPYDRTQRIKRESRIWDAVVASAAASQQSEGETITAQLP